MIAPDDTFSIETGDGTIVTSIRYTGRRVPRGPTLNPIGPVASASSRMIVQIDPDPAVRIIRAHGLHV